MGNVLPAAAPQLHVTPRIRSERPALDLHHPELRVREHETTHSPAAAALGAADIGEKDVRRPNPDE